MWEKDVCVLQEHRMDRGTPFPSHGHGEKSLADSQINLLKRALLHQRQGYRIIPPFKGSFREDVGSVVAAVGTFSQPSSLIFSTT